MSSSGEKFWILNLNRLFIYLFSLIGLFYGYDWAYVMALTLWVWLPSCTRAELKLINVYKLRNNI